MQQRGGKSIRMVRSSGSVGAGGSGGSGSVALSVTRKGAFGYARTPDGDQASSAPIGLDGTPASNAGEVPEDVKSEAKESKASNPRLLHARSLDQLLLSNNSQGSIRLSESDSVIDIDMDVHASRDAVPNGQSRSQSHSIFKRWKTIARFQERGERAAWAAVLLLAVIQAIGVLIYFRSHILASSFHWFNTRYSTDPLSPAIRALHAILSILFSAVVAPVILQKYSAVHRSSLLDLYWTFVAVVAISGIPSLSSEYLFWRNSWVFVHKSVWTAVISVAVVGFWIIRRMCTSNGAFFFTQNGRTKRRDSNTDIAMTSVTSARSSFSSRSARARYSSLSNSVSSSTANTATNFRKQWWKRATSSLEAHVGITSLIASTWSLTFLESFYKSALLKQEPSSQSGATADLASPRFIIAPFILLIAQVSVSFSLIYWGATSTAALHGRYNEAQAPTTQTVSKKSSRSTLLSSPFYATNSTAPNSRRGSQDSTTSSHPASEDFCDSASIAGSENMPNTSPSSTTPAIHTLAAASGAGKGGGSTQFVVKKKSSSSSFASHDALLRGGVKGARHGRVGRLERYGWVAAGITGAAVAGLVVAWFAVCMDACGRSGLLT
ncbi:hypothetical protein HDU80_009764 [Chytriomyces hyalinus]|nr:hypothetical protein HDU80_009764 [Chytriomyces hyalinus]